MSFTAPPSADDLGGRVTVRYRLDEPEAGASATDVVGTLIDIDENAWTVQRRNGTVVRVAANAVIIAKVIDEAAPR